MLEPVYIHRVNGRFPTENQYRAWCGFERMGHEIHFHDDVSPEVYLDCDLPYDAIVVGGVKEVRRAFSAVGIPYIDLEAIPDELQLFAGRKTWHSTVGEVVAEFVRGDANPVFIKPLPKDHKLFPGTVLKCFRDVLQLTTIDESAECLCSEVVDFISEWRVFVYHGQVVVASHYLGTPLIFPDPTLVTRMVESYAHKPVAFALDVGVTAKGETFIVEVNDCVALGAYGLRSYEYAQMIRDRWRELREEANG